MKEAVTKVIDMITQEDFHVAFQKFSKYIAAGGDYFEKDESFMCVVSIIKCPYEKSLETYLMILVYIYIYIYIYMCVCVCVCVCVSSGRNEFILRTYWPNAWSVRQ